MEENQLYTEKITAETSTYIFDINKSEYGDLYLKISENRKTESGFEQQSLIINSANLNDFFYNFKKSIRKYRELKDPEGKQEKAYSFDIIRQKYPQAYKPWTTDDDNKLEQLFCQGLKPKELATIFERKTGAINSRIKKLELKDKYPK